MYILKKIIIFIFYAVYIKSEDKIKVKSIKFKINNSKFLHMENVELDKNANIYDVRKNVIELFKNINIKSDYTMKLWLFSAEETKKNIYISSIKTDFRTIAVPKPSCQIIPDSTNQRNEKRQRKKAMKKESSSPALFFWNSPFIDKSPF